MYNLDVGPTQRMLSSIITEYFNHPVDRRDAACRSIGKNGLVLGRCECIGSMNEMAREILAVQDD